MGSIVCRRSQDDVDQTSDQETSINTKSNQVLFRSAVWIEEDADSIHNDLLLLRYSDRNQAIRAMRQSSVVFVDSAHEEKRMAMKRNVANFRSYNGLNINASKQEEPFLRCVSCEPTPGSVSKSFPDSVQEDRAALIRPALF